VAFLKAIAPWATGTPERRRKAIPFIVAILFALVYPVLINPILERLTGISYTDALVSILILVLLALGLNIVVGYAGLLDLGYAAFFAIGAYTAAFLTSPQSPLPFRTSFWIAMVLSFFVAMLFGVILGAPTLRLRGDYLAIVTLGFGEIVPRIFLNVESITGGTRGMNPIGKPSLFGVTMEAANSVAWYYLVIGVGLLSIFLINRMVDSRLGRAWMAIREDELAAASMGIDLVKTKLLAFALGASFAGFAGSIYASRFQFIDPFQFDFSISVMVLSMIILGGIGNIYGVIIGGVIMASYDRFFAENITGWLHTLGNSTHMELLTQLNLQNARLFIFGAALVLTMLLRPEGLFPSWRRAAELHEDDESSVIPPGPTDPDQQTLYDVEQHDEPVVGTE
jgi:branched-chain amino acid transport system permease protein